jgi:phenolic acid decarboxylase
MKSKKKNNRAIYKFHWDCGRMGDLSGVFSAEKQDIEAAIGREVYFGEVLGKHSEIFGILDKEDVTLVTDNIEFVQLFDKFEISSGFNPLKALREEGEDDE